MKTTFSDRLEAISQRIRSACEQANRPTSSVQLLAVTKGHSLSAVLALAECGLHDFGENYLQEALTKIHKAPQLTWHFIGAMQSNKTREIAKVMDWVHSVPSFKIAQRLNDQRPDAALPLNICLQVRLSENPNKQGAPLSEVLSLAKRIVPLPRLQLRGLMAYPDPSTDFDSQCRAYEPLLEVYRELQATYPVVDTLSIGTSSDVEAAIHCGATWVRVGTALLGARS